MSHNPPALSTSSKFSLGLHSMQRNPPAMRTPLNAGSIEKLIAEAERLTPGINKALNNPIDYNLNVVAHNIKTQFIQSKELHDDEREFMYGLILLNLIISKFQKEFGKFLDRVNANYSEWKQYCQISVLPRVEMLRKKLIQKYDNEAKLRSQTAPQKIYSARHSFSSSPPQVSTSLAQGLMNHVSMNTRREGDQQMGSVYENGYDNRYERNNVVPEFLRNNEVGNTHLSPYSPRLSKSLSPSPPLRNSIQTGNVNFNSQTKLYASQTSPSILSNRRSTDIANSIYASGPSISTQGRSFDPRTPTVSPNQHYSNLLNDYKERINEVKRDSAAINELHSQIENFQNQLQDLEDVEKELDNSLSQAIVPKYKESEAVSKLKQQLEELQKQLSNKSREVEEKKNEAARILEERNRKEKEEREKKEKEVEETRRILQQAQTQMNELEKRKKLLDDEINTYKSKHKKVSNEARNKMLAAERQLEENRAEMKKYIEEQKRIDDLLSKQQDELEKLKTETLEEERVRREMEAEHQRLLEEQKLAEKKRQEEKESKKAEIAKLKREKMLEKQRKLENQKQSRMSKRMSVNVSAEKPKKKKFKLKSIANFFRLRSRSEEFIDEFTEPNTPLFEVDVSLSPNSPENNNEASYTIFKNNIERIQFNDNIEKVNRYEEVIASEDTQPIEICKNSDSELSISVPPKRPSNVNLPELQDLLVVSGDNISPSNDIMPEEEFSNQVPEVISETSIPESLPTVHSIPPPPPLPNFDEILLKSNATKQALKAASQTSQITNPPSPPPNSIPSPPPLNLIPKSQTTGSTSPSKKQKSTNSSPSSSSSTEEVPTQTQSNAPRNENVSDLLSDIQGFNKNALRKVSQVETERKPVKSTLQSSIINSIKIRRAAINQDYDSEEESEDSDSDW